MPVVSLHDPSASTTSTSNQYSITATTGFSQKNVEADRGQQQQQQVLSQASLQDVAAIFPEYMSGAIRRDSTEVNGVLSWTAAITMAFPYFGKVDCLMSLAIRETKVEHIAMTLFGVHIEVEAAVHARQLVLPNGVRVMPSPEITLQGVHNEAIKRLLGNHILEAVDGSRVRQEELEQGTRATRCVSMIVPSNPSIGAIINLNLGLKEGSQIRNSLYRRFSGPSEYTTE